MATTHFPGAATEDMLDSFMDLVNRAHKAGLTVKVAGRRVKTQFRTQEPATSWGTGSVSVSVVGQARGTVGQIWVKPGKAIPDVETY